MGFIKADTQEPFLLGVGILSPSISTANPNTPIQLYFGDMQGFPWVDVRIEEVPELDPIARINLMDTDLQENITDNQASKVQIQTITLTEADDFNTGAVAGSYFRIQDGYGNNYYVWYSIGGTIDPAVVGFTGITVVISAGETPLEVAAATAAAISAELAFSAVALANIVTITNTDPGNASVIVLTDMPVGTTTVETQFGDSLRFTALADLFTDFPLIGYSHTASCNNSKEKQTRLLVDPVRRMDKMRIKVTLRDGRDPVEFYRAGVDLVFDLLLIAPETNIPEYVNQRLVY
jgi:hypothetical protein